MEEAEGGSPGPRTVNSRDLEDHWHPGAQGEACRDLVGFPAWTVRVSPLALFSSFSLIVYLEAGQENEPPTGVKTQRSIWG